MAEHPNVKNKLRLKPITAKKAKLNHIYSVDNPEDVLLGGFGGPGWSKKVIAPNKETLDNELDFIVKLQKEGTELIDYEDNKSDVDKMKLDEELDNYFRLKKNSKKNAIQFPADNLEMSEPEMNGISNGSIF